MGAQDFRALFDQELPFVLRALRRLGVREGDLADVAQELFVAVHARLAEHVDPLGTRRWLHAFCVRFAANYRRLARHRGTSLDDERGPPTPRAPGALDDAAAARDLVLRALEPLDYDRRVALVLHDLEGVSAPEIAALTATPLNTVYSRIRLAREAFRAEVARLGAGDPS